MARTSRGELSHHYNDDLLLRQGDREFAQKEFGPIFHVIDDPDLRDKFLQTDGRANDTKRNSQRAGIAAVAITVIGLALAASESQWKFSTPHVSDALAMLSAVLCVIAAIVAFQGGLFGTRKEHWLLDRLRTERLRQLHFQGFLCCLSEIAAAPHTDIERVRAFQQKRRDGVLARLHNDLEARADSKLEAILGPAGDDQIWLYGPDAPEPKVPDTLGAEVADSLFKAYRKLRLHSQLDYANHKLRRGGWSVSFGRLSLPQQKALLGTIWVMSCSLLVAVHLLVVVLVVGEIDHGVMSWVHVAAIWSALLALGARTIEHGLALAREIERYEDYRAAITGILRRFDAARTDSARLKAMIEMEKLSFEEMRNFLRAHHEASFVL